jgi:oxaloacetate decarboxylase gamma subunit
VPSSDLMLEGLTLMVFGMGFVFTFLTLLVLATKTMSATVLRFSPAEDLSLLNPPLTAVSPFQQVANDAQLMAVLSAAVHRYRQDRS